jgi:hypothetical protein
LVPAWETQRWVDGARGIMAGAGNPGADRDRSALSVEFVADAIQAFGDILGGSDLDVIHDERALPYPKEAMIHAFLAAMAAVDDDAIRGSLLQTYLQLASFLPGVGGTVAPPPVSAADAAAMRRLEETGDLDGSFAFLERRANDPAVQRYRELRQRTLDEEQRLRALYDRVFRAHA